MFNLLLRLMNTHKPVTEINIPTEHVEPHLPGSLAHAVGGHQGVEAGVGTLALLDEQCAAVVGHYLVDVLVVLELDLVLGPVGRSFVPGERWEGTAADRCHDADVGALLSLNELFQLDGWSACSTEGEGFFTGFFMLFN